MEIPTKLAICIPLAIAVQSAAETVTIPVAEDTMLSRISPDNNFGEHLFNIEFMHRVRLGWASDGDRYRALSRFDFPGKGLFRLLILLTRAFPLPLLALPLAVMFIRTGLDDTVFGLALVHTTLAIPFAVLITFSLFSGIPLELEEAAWTLGCTRITAFTKVVLPLILPGITASAIFAFVISWNEVFAAAVLTIENRTLTAFLLQNLDTSPLHLKFAGGFILVVPALIFIFAVRKYLFAMWGIANR